jgi:hypothetical protein
MSEKLKTRFRMVWGFLRIAWWAILLAVVIVAIVILRRKDEANEIELDDALSEKTPSFSMNARERIDQALVDVKVDHAIIKEQSAAKRKELQEIRRDKDKKARLDKLAFYLEQNL